MVTRISLLAVSFSLVAYFASSHFRKEQSHHNPSIDLKTKAIAFKSKSPNKPFQSKSNYIAEVSGLEVLQTVKPKPIANAELIMDDSLASLHLNEFTEYLHGERASESTTLAFYTDSRWSEFYKQVGYSPDDIDQLITFRNQYLADTSQSGKEYYWYSWSDAPHRSLADSLAYRIISYLGNSDNNESTLSNSIADIASEYGITVSLVERIANTYLLNSIGTIESTSIIFNSSFDQQVDVIKFDSVFIEYLKEQAGYQKTINIDKSLRGMSSTYSANNNETSL